MPGLGTSFGRGGATTAQQDLTNADAILIMGSSMAENHPVGFQWVIEARENAAPRSFTSIRASRALRPWPTSGCRCAPAATFFSSAALINYVLENNRDFREYVVHYTNASTHFAR